MTTRLAGAPTFPRRWLTRGVFGTFLALVGLVVFAVALAAELLHPSSSSAPRLVALFLLLFVLLFAIDTLLREVTQRLTAAGASHYGLTGKRQLLWREVTSWSGLGRGRWVPTTVRLRSPSRYLDVRPGWYEDPEGVYKQLESVCSALPVKRAWLLQPTS